MLFTFASDIVILLPDVAGLLILFNDIRDDVFAQLLINFFGLVGVRTVNFHVVMQTFNCQVIDVNPYLSSPTTKEKWN